jgi:hypothetical protein
MGCLLSLPGHDGGPEPWRIGKHDQDTSTLYLAFRFAFHIAPRRRMRQYQMTLLRTILPLVVEVESQEEMSLQTSPWVLQHACKSVEPRHSKKRSRSIWPQ